MSNVARKLIHDEFNVTSTSPTEGGFTLFKFKSGAEEEEELVNRLRRRFPLSAVSLVEDDLQGTSSIHMLVPSEEELESQAGPWRRRGEPSAFFAFRFMSRWHSCSSSLECTWCVVLHDFKEIQLS